MPWSADVLQMANIMLGAGLVGGIRCGYFQEGIQGFGFCGIRTLALIFFPCDQHAQLHWMGGIGIGSALKDDGPPTAKGQQYLPMPLVNSACSLPPM